MDRLSPTRRPTDQRLAQYQSWRTLLFLHWRVPAAVLRPLVPAALELDTFEGDCFLGVVPFTMRGVRPWWAPSVPGLSNFHEANVRTYVHHQGQQPGVWFLSLDAANAIAVQIARTFWHLPYYKADMSLTREGDTISYRSERRWPAPVPAHLSARYTPVGAPQAATPGTLEHFLAERYLLYASGAGGSLWRGQVYHTPYPLQAAQLHAWEESLSTAAGAPHGPEAPLAHFASGVDVDVFDLQRL